MTAETANGNERRPDASSVNVGIEAGVGFAIVLKDFFVFRPEFIYGHWLTDQGRFVGVPAEAIENHTMQQFALRFSFYGL